MRMIPGRVRQEGKRIYQQGAVSFVGYQNGLREFLVGEEEVVYSQDGSLDKCSCQNFENKGYCSHIAAVENYLREADSEEGLRKSTEKTLPVPLSQLDTFEGTQFFKHFLSEDSSKAYLSLEVEGSLLGTGDRLAWTLRVRYGASKAYIMRDIPNFLQRLEFGDSYRLNRALKLDLSWEILEPASRALCNFLLSLDAEPDASSLFYQKNGRYLYLPFPLLKQALPFFQKLEGFQILIEERRLTDFAPKPLSEVESPYQIDVQVQTAGYKLDFQVLPQLALFDHQILYYLGGFYQVPYEVGLFHQELFDRFLSIRNRQQELLLDGQQISDLYYFRKKYQGVVQVLIPKTLQEKDFTVHLTLDKDPKGWLHSRYYYEVEGNKYVEAHQLTEAGIVLDPLHYRAFEEVMRAAGFPMTMVGRRLPFSEADFLKFFQFHLPHLQEVAQVTLSPAFGNIRQEMELNITVEEGHRYLQVHFSMEGIDKSEIQEAVEILLKGGLFKTKAGKYVGLAQKDRRQLQALVDLEGSQWDWQSGQVQVKRQLLGRLQSILQEGTVTYSQALDELLNHLANPASFPLPQNPILEQLRDYQKVGVAWLSMQAHYGFGGILADDMGLGKTIQAICFLALHLEPGKKALVVVPSGLLYNWQDEFQRFAPHLSVGHIYGSKQERLQVLESDHQIYLTSYGSLRQDVTAYQNRSFQSLILDEAQYLKNQRTKVHASLEQIEAQSIFALSGTPVENRIEEIGAIFNLVLPGLLPAKKTLLKMPVEAVAQQIRPFILRRDKQEILKELPEKSEGVYVTELLPEQKTLYLAQLSQMQEQLEGLSEQEFRKRKVEFLAGLTRLRQICDSPALFLENYQGKSGKLEALKEMVARAKESGQRLLIFSQFVGMLDLVAELVEQQGLNFYTIQGSTPAQERQEISHAFNQGQGDGILISLKAGGVGLNLTGADTVFLLDLWWNPAVEEQAIGRAHRMGQQNPVQVYRFITKGSIEEKIFELQENKRNLLGSILDAGRPNEAMSLEEIKEILGIS
ncbi:SNF2 helicase associated domain-containing protein [Streptococcus sp. 121]|uniref:DEAD/DEAH box helicase n=1 Tax=Streptococcus sp. 121 TaxID=2797637 RepID=UPI0018F0CF64|nr:SNF2-related protein [Streptococcus sp. 121]MBJ6746234.1 SNF2 helicase associated domain-containing protein [Streptococcus sp. 121]